MRWRDSDATIGWITINESSLIVGANEGAAEIIGTRIIDLVGSSVTEIIPPQYRERHFVAVGDRVKGKPPSLEGQPLHLPMLRADGTIINVAIVISMTQEHPARFTATFFEINSPLEKKTWLTRLLGR